MAKLNINPNIEQPDDYYQKLIDLHEGRSDAESMKINAKLIMILSNHIGDREILDEAILLADKS